MKFLELIVQFRDETTANKPKIESLLALNSQQFVWQPAPNKRSIM